MNGSQHSTGPGAPPPETSGAAYQSPPATAHEPPGGRWGTARAQTSFDPHRKSPGLAALLSVVPGLGQIYIGYYVRGFVHAVTVALIITLLAEDMDELNPLLALFLGFFWLYNIVDAGRRAALYNQALAGGEEIELPGDVRLPRFRGTVAGGAALIVLGVILLSNTAFDFSLRWVEDWWPVAPIAGGVYLIYRALAERGESAPRDDAS